MNKSENISTDEILDALKKIIASSQKKWLRTDEVCDYLSISTSQLQIYKNEGYFSVMKLGGTNFYDREEIDQVMEDLKCEVRL